MMPIELVRPEEIEGYPKPESMGKYLNLARKRGLLTEDGEFLLVLEYGWSGELRGQLAGREIPYPNYLAFTSEEAAQNYVDLWYEHPNIWIGAALYKKVKRLK